jgi:guanylate kinase
MTQSFQNTGKAIIVSAPSGAGKTTLVHYLLRELNELSFSISACSREPRWREENGVDYHFISAEDFKKKIDSNEFVEWEEVYENQFYGTLRSEITRIWSLGKVVVFDVDVKGGINLKKIFGESSLSIFVKPPSLFVLEQRLRDRKTENEEGIQKRLRKASQEMLGADKFDKILLNDNLEKACLEAKELVKNFISKK